MSTTSSDRALVATWLPRPLAEELKAAAAESDRSVSAEVRLALRDRFPFMNEAPVATPKPRKNREAQSRHDTQ